MSFTKVWSIEIFLVEKLINGRTKITKLPQTQSVEQRPFSDFNWILEWSDKELETNISKKDSYLVMFQFIKPHHAPVIYVLQPGEVDYTCYSTSSNNCIRYRCANKIAGVDDLETISSIYRDYCMLKIPKSEDPIISSCCVDRGVQTSLGFRCIGMGIDYARSTPTQMPTISEVYYNNPHTTIKWSDGTITTVTASESEHFSKEFGLAMAISRKYYECLGFVHPRAAFKREVNNADDQTEKIAERRAYKLSRMLLNYPIDKENLNAE